MPSRFPARTSATALFTLAALTSGCAGPSGTYPSLAPRPIERLSLAEPDRPPPPPAVADPAATTRYAPMIAKARTADADFDRVLQQERGALERGRGAAVGSDAWTIAQVALTRIETARGAVAKVLADFDAARAGDPSRISTGELVASEQAFDEVERIDNNEKAKLAAVWPSGA